MVQFLKELGNKKLLIQHKNSLRKAKKYRLLRTFLLHHTYCYLSDPKETLAQ